MEIAAALVGAIAFAVFSSDLALAVAGTAFGWLLLLLAALDFRHLWLPDKLTFLLAVLGIAASLLRLGPDWQSSASGLAGGFASLALVRFIYRRIRGREGLGGGDPKLFGAIGAWVGLSALPWVLFAACMVGLATAPFLVGSSNSRVGPLRIPLGALLCLAAWPVWLTVH